MKACILLQNQYTKLGHSIAINLKEKHNVTEFCGFVFSPWAKDFIQKQTDIKYNAILEDSELHANYKNEEVDTEYIKYFEKTYGPPHLWHFLYSDRKLMMSIGPKEESTTNVDPLYNHEDLMRIFQARAKAIEKMLKEEKPDFILFFAIGTLSHLLLYHIAKKLGIRTFNVDFPRVNNLVSLSEDYNTLTGVIEHFDKIKNSVPNATEAKQAQDFLDSLNNTASLNLEYVKIDEVHFRGNDSLLNPKNLSRSIKYLFTLCKNYYSNRGVFHYGVTSQNPILFIWHKLKRRYRKMLGLEHLYSEVKEGEDYLFYPLHYEPELSTLVLSHFYFEQLDLIRKIARALPLHYKLYVKEHPTMVYHRPISYYQELLKIPNVKLVSHKIKSVDLIKKSKMVATITSTVGWEAALLEKPTITFGNVFYNELSFVKRIHDLESLPSLIPQEIANSKNRDKNEVINILISIFKDGIPLNFVSIWYEGDHYKTKDDEGVLRFCNTLMKKVNTKHE